MDRQTVIAFVLIGAILIIWLFLNSPKPPVTPSPNQIDTTHVTRADTIPKPVAKKQIKEIPKPVAKDTAVTLGKYFQMSNEKERIITINNDLVTLELSTNGANIRKCYLKKYKNWYSSNSDSVNYNTMVQLINYSLSNAYDIAFVTSDGIQMLKKPGIIFQEPTASPWNLPPEREAKDRSKKYILFMGISITSFLIFS